MSAKIISNLFWLFAFLCVLLLVQTDNQPASTSTSPDIKEHSLSNNIKSDYVGFSIAYKKVTEAKTDDEKLVAIEQALKVAAQEKFDDLQILQNLNLVAASIHESRWHIVYALEYFRSAQNIIYQERVERRITELRKYISQLEAERGLNDDYIATKNTGPAKAFRGKILVAYVFVDDGIKTRWSNKDKQRTQKVLSSVQDWQLNKASEYQVEDIEFINKTFVARRNPSLKRPKSVSFKSSHEEINQYVEYIAQSLGAETIGEFIENQSLRSGADQGVVFLHTNLDERSFANRCGYTHKQKIYRNGRYETKLISKCNDEYVMLMEQVKRNRWDKMHYAQAHEMMHVFGAADLYNIKKASNYAVTDIMNFQSKNLAYSRVEPITAFAIGWQHQPPKAPFKVLER